MPAEWKLSPVRRRSQPRTVGPEPQAGNRRWRRAVCGGLELCSTGMRAGELSRVKLGRKRLTLDSGPGLTLWSDGRRFENR